MRIISWLFGIAMAGFAIFLIGPFVFEAMGLTGHAVKWPEPLSRDDPILENTQIAMPVRTLATNCELPQLMSSVPIYAISLYNGGIETAVQEFGTEARQVDVMVTDTSAPIALILSARDAVIWNLRLAPGAKIAAVVTTGFDRQPVVSKQTAVKVLPATLGDEQCKSQLRRQEGPAMLEQLTDEELMNLSQLAFNRPPTLVIKKSSAEQVILGPEEKVTEIPAETDPFVVPHSLVDGHRPILFGRPALQRLVAEGVLSQASTEDIAQWKKNGQLASEVPSFIADLDLTRTFVVRRPFRMPLGVKGLAASAFLIPRGMKEPEAWPWEENVYLLSLPFGCKHSGGWFENCGKVLSSSFEPVGYTLKSPGGFQ